MSKIYLVKNTLASAQDVSEWIEMNGFDFYKFVKSPEAAGRFFIKLPSLSAESNDDAIVIESNETQYRQWCREENHKHYLKRFKKGYTVISYHAMQTDDECYGEELLPDDSVDVEATVEMIMALENLADAMTKLSAEEKWLIYEYFSHEKDQPGIAAMLGITQQAVSKRVARIIEKLRKIRNI